MDMEKLAEAIASTLKIEVAKVAAPLLVRITEIERREPAKGEPGKDADPADIARAVQAAVTDAVAEAVSALPPPKDGQSVTLDDVAPLVDATVERAVAALPVPQDGKDGSSVTVKDIEPLLLEMVGALPAPKDGIDGKSVTIDELRPLVEQAVASVPVPKDGRDGRDGQSVTVDQVMAALAPSIEAAIAKAVLETERRGMDLIQRAIERIPLPKDGAPGRDGTDGFSLEDLTIDDDGDGTMTLRFVRGDLVREKTIRYPRLDRGIFRDEGEYRKGDGVTYGGSWWIAQKDAPGGKPGLSDDWRLAVKKGRDGRDGRDGIDKTLPVKV
jgi:hypothetical protein